MNSDLENEVYSKYLQGYSIEAIQELTANACRYWFLQGKEIHDIIDAKNLEHGIW